MSEMGRGNKPGGSGGNTGEVCDGGGQNCRPMTQAEYDRHIKYSVADIGADLRNFNQCIDICLNTTYGDTYRWAKNLSPFSVTSLATNEVTEVLDEKLRKTGTSNSYGKTRSEHLRGMRQLRTLSQFRAFNAAGAVTGAGAFGFMTGANAYCAVECVP